MKEKKIGEKYANKSPLMRFLHKNTGFLVCFGILAVAVPWWFYEVNNQEFFENWSCSQIQIYLLTYNQDVHDRGFPDHEHLTDEQHVLLHEIVLECDFQTFEHKFN